MNYRDMIEMALMPMDIEVSEEQKKIIEYNIINVNNIVCAINNDKKYRELRSTQVIGFIIFYSLKELKLI